MPVQFSVKVLPLVKVPLDWLPAVALDPDQASEAVQDVAFVEIQVSVDEPPLVTDVGLATRDTVGAGAAGALAVVKNHATLPASALPAISFAAVVMVAVYWPPPTRLANGVSVAVLPLMLTVAGTSDPLVADLK